jgi:hypothetical protein
MVLLPATSHDTAHDGKIAGRLASAHSSRMQA